MGWKTLGQDAPDRGRDTSVKFGKREEPNFKMVQFKADTEWVQQFNEFCKDASISKSAFLRYAARKKM